MKHWKTPKGTELPIMSIKGKDYLQVMHRLVWFREEKPHWSIETEIVVTDKDSTVAKATIRNEAGQVLATAHKQEDRSGFADHLEKSETGAIGRALALVGFGTQFCADDLNEGQRLADSPVGRSTPIFSDQPGPKDGVSPKMSRNDILSGSFVKRKFSELTLEELQTKEHILSGKVKLSHEELQDLETVRAHIEVLKNLDPEETVIEKCRQCQSTNLMASRYNAHEVYCRDCRSKQSKISTSRD